MESSTFKLDDKYEFISFNESLNLTDCRHAAHCCIYSPHSFPTVESCKSKAYISMQMRFDGCLGFPGGIIGKGNVDIVDGLNRELLEEINLDKKHFVDKKNHYFTHFCREQNWCFHFFAKEVSVDDFLAIEKNALNAQDYGEEVLGVIRVPLCIMKDNKRGFPAFLLNNFAGCAKDQLLNFLMHANLMLYDDITKCLPKSQSK